MNERSVTSALAAVLFALLGVAGCADDAVTPCVADADCASGTCNPDGTCAPLKPDAVFPMDDAAGSDALPDGSGSPDATSDAAPEGGPDTPAADTDAATPDTPPGSCIFGDDWIVSRDEYPLAAGQHATYRVAHDVGVDTGGDATADGFAWDFSGAYDGDQDVLITAQDPSEWWFDGVFPGATYTARLSSDEDLMGVFQLTDDALLLLGVASPEGGLFRTELTYDPPAVILQFPLQQGDSWSTTSTVSGLTNGVASVVSETYDMSVDARGQIETPFSSFDVLRVATELTRWVGAAPYTERQLSWVAECFGVVASARSQAYATQVDFGDAAELRRLAK